jgi:uncharacterized protein YpmB
MRKYKKISILIFFVYFIYFNHSISEEFWSNTVDGPTTKEQAIKLLEEKI